MTTFCITSCDLYAFPVNPSFTDFAICGGCRSAVGKISSIGRLRGLVRQMLQDELQEIDALVTQILKQGIEND